MSKFSSTIFYVAMTFTLVQAAISQTPAWKASIVSVSSEAPEFISGERNKERTSPYWPGRPAGHRWIALTVQLSSPSKEAKVAASNIHIVSKEGTHPVTAVGYLAKPKDSIVYLPLLILSSPYPESGITEAKGSRKAAGGWSPLYAQSAANKSFDVVSVGYFENMDIKKMLFEVIIRGEGGGRELQLAKSPLNVVLLFAVPEGATNLQLKFGEAELVSVPGSP